MNNIFYTNCTRPRAGILFVFIFKTNMPKRNRKSKNIRGVEFHSCGELKNYVRKMIKEKSLNVDFLNALLDFYPKKEKKLNGRGGVGWKVDGNGLIMVFSNNEVETISFLSMCTWVFTDKENEAKRRLSDSIYDFKQAARYEVDAQISRFRSMQARNNLKYLCGKTYHVGHDYEKGKRFDEILKDFMQLQENTIVKLKRLYHEPKYTKYQFNDRYVANKWFKYHSDHAILQMETCDDNLRGNAGFNKAFGLKSV